MGDDLPELLYKAWATALGLPYGSDDCPGFANLDTEKRYAWEQVAAKARGEIGIQLARDMRDAAAELGTEQAIANLVEARLG